MRRSGFLLSAILLGAVPPAMAQLAGAQSASIAAQLERDRQGEFDAVLRELAAEKDPRRLARVFIRAADAWTVRDLGSARQRRLAAAPLALEQTHARLASDWRVLRETVEWTSKELARGQPSPAERTFVLAVVARGQRARDSTWLTRTGGSAQRHATPQLDRAMDRFPDEPRLRPAKLVVPGQQRHRQEKDAGGGERRRVCRANNCAPDLRNASSTFFGSSRLCPSLGSMLNETMARRALCCLPRLLLASMSASSSTDAALGLGKILLMSFRSCSRSVVNGVIGTAAWPNSVTEILASGLASPTWRTNAANASRMYSSAPGVVSMGQASQGPDTSTRAVAGAAAAYVAEYRRQLTSILADERYTQTVITQIPPDASAPRARSMRSEVFFMFAPGNRNWMAIRDVVAVDGRAVGERPDIREALRTLPARDVAATFKTYNSRFNIGRMFRNFNEPTLSLLVLDDEHRSRFSFDRKRVNRSGDAVLVTLAFTERERPTLIRDLRQGSVFAKGELIVEADTGRIRRAVLTANIGPVKLQLTTAYAHDPRLGLWVPATFREHYEYGVAANDAKARPELGAQYETILCEATYTNYRRFETSARIK